MAVYEIKLREEVDACHKENVDPNAYLLIKNRLFASISSLQRFAPYKWTPQVLNAFKASSPSQLKEYLIVLLPLSTEESVSLDKLSLDAWFHSLCSLLDEHIFIYLLYERAYKSYRERFSPRLKEIVALGFVGGYSGLEAVDVTDVLVKLTGREIKTSEDFDSSLNHRKVKRAIEKVLRDEAVANAIDKTVEFLNQQTVEYFRPRLLDAVDTALWGLFNEASVFVDTHLRAAKGLPPLRDWRNQQITHLSTLKRRESIARLEVIEQGKPKGVKKRPKALMERVFQSKEEFYGKLYDAIQRRSHLANATKDVVATKYLKLKNEKQLDSILRHFEDERTWKQIRDHALKPGKNPQ